MTKKAILTESQAAMLATIDASHKLADSTKRQYKKALTNYWAATGESISNTLALAYHAQGLSASSRGFLKAAIRKVTESKVRDIKSNVTPETVDVARAALWRIEAVQDTIEVEASNGKKTHIWLSQSEVRALFVACGNGIVGQRDKVVVGLLVAAGLRREEAAKLRFDDIKVKPMKGNEGRYRTVLDIKGKGRKQREVPISDKFAAALEEWREVCGDGYVCRSLGMNRELGESLSPVAVFNIVRKRAERIGFDGVKRPKLAAHDLRRTYAQLGLDAGVPITQISILLGHSNVAVTQRYLNLDVDLETTISDFIPFE
jgi:integrase